MTTKVTTDEAEVCAHGHEIDPAQEAAWEAVFDLKMGDEPWWTCDGYEALVHGLIDLCREHGVERIQDAVESQVQFALDEACTLKAAATHVFMDVCRNCLGDEGDADPTGP